MRGQRYAVAVLACLLTWPASAHASRWMAERGPDLRAHRPSLEEIAYRFWGDRLETACPNRSLRFTISRRPPAAAVGVEDATPIGVSWGDCNPWVRRDRWALTCYAALHESGHEVGLAHTTNGDVMDPQHEIVGSVAVIHTRNGTVRHRQTWTGLPAVCRPGHWR